MSNPNFLLNDDGLPPLEMPSEEEIARVRAAMGPSRIELLRITQLHIEYRKAAELMLRRCATDLDLLLCNPEDPGMRARARQLVDSINAMPSLPEGV